MSFRTWPFSKFLTTFLVSLYHLKEKYSISIFLSTCFFSLDELKINQNENNFTNFFLMSFAKVSVFHFFFFVLVGEQMKFWFWCYWMKIEYLFELICLFIMKSTSGKFSLFSLRLGNDRKRPLPICLFLLKNFNKNQQENLETFSIHNPNLFKKK